MGIKIRAPFVTLWLWLGVIVNIVLLPYLLIQYHNLKNIYDAGGAVANAVSLESLFLQLVVAINAVLAVYGYILIIKWSKKGFYALCITPIFSILQAVGMYLVQEEFIKIGLSVYPIYSLLLTVISSFVLLAILWFVLRMQRDGKSCWELLE